MFLFRFTHQGRNFSDQRFAIVSCLLVARAMGVAASEHAQRASKQAQLASAAASEQAQLTVCSFESWPAESEKILSSDAKPGMPHQWASTQN